MPLAVTSAALPASQSTAEERSHEILFSIRQAFAEKGFDGASMQDLARAAGMSVGNFYRYFPSKAAIVQAMCSLDLAEIQGDFSEITGSPTPMSCLRAKILSHFGEESRKDGQLWAEITAAAIRKPEIGEASREMEDTIVSMLAAVFGHVTGRSVEEARQRYEGQCEMLILLVKSMAMRTSQCGPASPALADQVVQVIDRILAEISNDTVKG